MSRRQDLLLAVFTLLVFSPITAVAQKLPDIPLWPINNIGPEIESKTIDDWRSRAFYCDGKARHYAKFPSRRPLGENIDPNQKCEDGDMNLFNGMLCAIGEKSACNAVKQAQAKGGQWFRSPRRMEYFKNICVKPETYSGTTPDGLCLATFSPDMALGTMLYAVKTNDKTAYKNWYQWLRNNTTTTKLCSKECTCVDLPWPRVCQYDYVKKDRPDGTCNIVGECSLRPADSPDFRVTAQHLSVTQALGSSAFDNNLLPNNLPVLALAERGGFPQHLDATRILLRMLIVNNDLKTTYLPSIRTLSKQSPKELGEFNPIYLRASALALERKSPWNPYFSLLAHGPTSNVKAKILESCPKLGEPSNGFAWLWEQAPDGLHRAPINSSGWDCIFVATLYNKMRVSPKMSDQLLDLIKESLDPIQMTINSLNVALTAQKDAIGKAQNLKDEHARLTKYAESAMRDAESSRKNIENQISSLQGDVTAKGEALANLGCDTARAVLRRYNNVRRRLDPVGYEVARRAVRRCDEALNALVAVNSQMSGLQAKLREANAEIAKIPITIETNKNRIAEIESQHLIDKLGEMTEELSRLVIKMQDAKDNEELMQGFNSLWSDQPPEPTAEVASSR